MLTYLCPRCSRQMVERAGHRRYCRACDWPPHIAPVWIDRLSLDRAPIIIVEIGGPSSASRAIFAAKVRALARIEGATFHQQMSERVFWLHPATFLGVMGWLPNVSEWVIDLGELVL